MRLVECVPNFSEGRDPALIAAITSEIESVEGIALLDVDPGAATNRTVVTFVGSPVAVLEAAFRAIARAAALIDMTTHHGEHPRMGATDVCPFIPVEGVTMEECADLARALGRRVGAELGIPVYLYGAAASRPERVSLADVRRGEYEGLAARPDSPDFGPGEWNPGTGATAVGAREFLIAYNINLNTRDRKLANAVAGALRETGTPRRGADGSIVRAADGTAVRDPGRFTECRGVGWYIPEYGRAQVSLNLTNFRVTSLYAVFDAAREEAVARGLRVTGSEIVGLVPRAALLAAGDHYLGLQGSTTGIPESERVHAAVLSLGLDEVVPFDPATKVIEYRFAGSDAGLVAQSVRDFADEVSGAGPTPGGGSVAALAGSLAASLTSMVAALTWSKRGMEASRDRMQEIGIEAQRLKDAFLSAVESDAIAFDAVLAANRLPRRTDEDQQARAAAQEAANRHATMVPLDVLEMCPEVAALALEAVCDGNPNSITDAAVAGALARAAAEGASWNVRVNLGSITDATLVQQIDERREKALDRTREIAIAVAAAVDEGLA